MKIAVFSREIDDAYISKVELLLDSLNEKGAELFYFKDFCEKIKQLITIPQGGIFTSYEDIPKDTGVLLALGGDGTFLSALTFIRESNIPVAGINFGRLGFLTTVKMSDDIRWVDDIINSSFSIEKRSLIKLESPSLMPDIYPYALNDITLQRRSNSMLGIKLTIDGFKAPVYWADGLLISTPTGSTAYSLAVGGPIITPMSRVLIIAPIAPHNLNIRPLVVPDSSTIELSLISRDEEALLTIDNQTIILPANEKVVIKRGDFSLNYLSLGGNTFMGALNEKLLWGEDRRNR